MKVFSSPTSLMLLLLSLVFLGAACGGSEEPAAVDEAPKKAKKAVAKKAPVVEDEDEELTISSLMREGAGDACPSFFEDEKVACAMAAFGSAGRAKDFPKGEQWFLGLLYNFDARSTINPDEPMQRPEVSVLLTSNGPEGVAWSAGLVTAETAEEDAFLLKAQPDVGAVLAGRGRDFEVPSGFRELFAAAVGEVVILSDEVDGGYVVGDGLGELRRVDGGWIAGAMAYSSNDELQGFQIHVFTDAISSLNR